MADVLSQAEVNALLTALDPVLQSKAYDRLDGADRGAAAGVPEPAANDSQSCFPSLLDNFPANLTAALGQKLNAPIKIEWLGQRVVRFEELSGGPAPRLVQFAHSELSLLRWALAWDQSILLAMIDRLLGGAPTKNDVNPPAAFTEIEQGIVLLVTNLTLASLRKSLQERGALDLQLVTVESDTVGDGGIAAVEEVVCCEFQLSVATMTGPLSVCMPLVEMGMLGQLRSAAAMLPSAVPDETAVWNRRNEPNQQETSGRTREAIVNLAQTTLTDEDVRNLAIGDVIVTDSKASDGVEMVVIGHRRYHSVPGTVNGRKAAQLGAPVDPPPADREPGQPTSETESTS